MAEFQARDKLAFLLSLVPWLMDHDGASVAEAAEHFGVAPQQIRDAVELIAVSGVPGDTDSYQHGDLFDINWDAFEERDEIVLTNLVAIDDSPRFSAREATALIAGLQYLSSLPENAGQRHPRQPHGEAQPRRVGRTEPGRRRGGRDGCRASAPTLALIRDSVARGRAARARLPGLRGAARASPRRPAARRVVRRRLVPARLVPPARGGAHVPPRPHLERGHHRRSRSSTAPTRSGLPDRLFEASPDDLEVTIEVAPAAMPLLADYIPDGATSTEVDGRIRTTLRVSHFHGLKRLIASMPGVADRRRPAERPRSGRRVGGGRRCPVPLRFIT